MKTQPTLHQLRLFERTARLGSFKKAADAMHLTLPALSIQIRQLEDTLGAALFDRIGRRKHLSAAGREVLTSCHTIFQEFDNMEMRLSQLRGGWQAPYGSVRSAAPSFSSHT